MEDSTHLLLFSTFEYFRYIFRSTNKDGFMFSLILLSFFFLELGLLSLCI